MWMKKVMVISHTVLGDFALQGFIALAILLQLLNQGGGFTVLFGQGIKMSGFSTSVSRECQHIGKWRFST